MSRNRLLYLLLLLPLLVATGCDNVGRAFDRDVNPDGPDTETGTSNVQVVPRSGTTIDARPRVVAAYPDGAGWPTTVPIVVEFSESVNEASIAPTTPSGLDGRIGLRAQGSTQLLPCSYDLIANGRLLILRPLQPLQDNGGIVYEVVLFPEARDVDGVRFLVSDGENVLTDFQVNQSESITDGRVLAVYPDDNARNHPREGDVFVVFDRPANVGTLVATNVTVGPQNGTPVAAAVTTPLSTVGITDGRVVRINPNATLSGATLHELTVSENITFGTDGNLDFNGAVPFSVFTTVAPAAPTAVQLGNPTTGFPNKINQTNVTNAMLRVTTPADTLAGDRVIARVYGSDALTTPTFDLDFLEREVTVPAAGAQDVTLDFSSLLGSITDPKFDDGAIQFAARIVRGGDSSGYAREADDADARFDVTPPTLETAGPPASDDGTTLFTDLEALAFYGTASEEVAEATLTVGMTNVNLFASAADGRFLMLPVQLGRLTTGVAYSLSLTDTAGNAQLMPSSGTIVQYGLSTGTLAGTLTVHAYDHATLRPIEGATVLVDPVPPTVPATGQLLGTTDVQGRVTFPTAASGHTVTIVRAGYDLVSIYDSQAAVVSLPLTPMEDATAIQRGAAGFAPAPGTTALVGNTAVVEGGGLGVRTTNAAPNEIPDTVILPNRPQLLTAFGGAFEPTTSPAFTLQGCQMLGTGLLDPTAPVAPSEPGAVDEATVVLLDAGLTFGSLQGAYTRDFGNAVGLDTNTLVTGDPIVRVTASLFGFGGQALIGVGYIDSSAGAVYDVQANFSLPIHAGLVGFAPFSWLAIEGEDASGNLSRTRGVLAIGTGQVAPGVGPLPIPAMTPPAGPFTGPPSVTYLDVLAPGAGTIGVVDVTATDGNGRRWRMFVPDRDPATGDVTVQFPDLATNNVVGLVAGTWSMLVESRLALSVSAIDDALLSERIRSEIEYTRGAPVPFTIQ